MKDVIFVPVNRITMFSTFWYVAHNKLYNIKIFYFQTGICFGANDENYGTREKPIGKYPSYRDLQVRPIEARNLYKSDRLFRC